MVPASAVLCTGSGLAAEENWEACPNVPAERTSAVQSLFQRHVLDDGALIETILPHCFWATMSGAHAQAGCQHAVVAPVGGATALDVAEDGVTGLDAGHAFHFVGHVFTNAAERADDRPSRYPCWP